MTEHLTWKHSSENYETPISKEIIDAIHNGTAHLKSHSSDQVTISGWYLQDEIYKGNLKDLGIARANKIKKLFLDKGVPAQQIIVKSRLKHKNLGEGNMLTHGADFSFNQEAPTDTMKALLFVKTETSMAKSNSKRQENMAPNSAKEESNERKPMTRKIQPKKKRKWVLPLLILAIAAMVAAAYFQSKNKKSGTEVELSEATIRNINETVSASGKIFPIQEVKISSDVSGEIIDLYVSEGDSVRAGQILVRIDSEVYASAVERGNASVAGSQSRLEQARATATSSEANISTLRTQLDQAKNVLNRSKKLFEEGVIAEAEYESSQAEVNRLEASIQASIATAASANASIKSAQSDVQSAQASLKELRTNLSRTTIKAPSNGVISVLNVEQGERVVGTAQMTGTEMMRIANMNTMEVQVEVSENDILRVSLADSVSVDVDAYLNRRFSGVVSEIANSAVNSGSSSSLTSDEVTNFIVTIIISPDSYTDIINEGKIPFRPGMSASVDINTETRKCVTVPIQAVTTRDKEAFNKANKSKKKVDLDDLDEEDLAEVVFIMKADTVSMVKVVTGIQDDEFIEVQEGISAGDVIVSGPYSVVSRKLKEGEEVSEKEDKEEETEEDDS